MIQTLDDLIKKHNLVSLMLSVADKWNKPHKD